VSDYTDSTKRAFEKAFDEYSEDLFRYCLFRLNDRDRAEEIVQEAFMKSWQSAINGDRIQNLRAYLYKIVHNLTLNEYRNRKSIASLEELMESSNFDPGNEATQEQELEARLAIQLLDKLEPPYRDVMTLRYVNDLPVKEIANILGENETSISVKIHRAIKKLQKLIEYKST
jgi:RNA polymerase sigma-70 factor (ECF subfamily)